MFFLSALKWAFNSEMCIIHSQPLTGPSWGRNFATHLCLAFQFWTAHYSYYWCRFGQCNVPGWALGSPTNPVGTLGTLGSAKLEAAHLAPSRLLSTVQLILRPGPKSSPFLDPLPLNSPLSFKLVGASLSQPHQPMGKVRESEWGVPTRDSQICVQGVLATLSYISPDWALCACSVQAHSELSLCNNTFCCISAKSVSHRCKVI